MFEQIILGVIQGVTEWLPVSSEGVLVLTRIHLFGDQSLTAVIQNALFLHLGTFLAALVYFRAEVWQLIKTALAYLCRPKTLNHLLGDEGPKNKLLRSFQRGKGLTNFQPGEVYKKSREENQKLFQFLLVSTLISSFLGFYLFKLMAKYEEMFSLTGKMITLAVGILLLLTGWLQLKSKEKGLKLVKDLGNADGVWLGLVQGLAALPGLSRSGLTVSTFLLRGFDKQQALRLSFLMSLPIVLAGNIFLNWAYFSLNSVMLWGLLASFVFGLITIHGLLGLARRVNFGYFVILFGILTIFSVLV
jgi:undecaprenyl-diphosphatase